MNNLSDFDKSILMLHTLATLIEKKRAIEIICGYYPDDIDAFVKGTKEFLGKSHIKSRLEMLLEQLRSDQVTELEQTNEKTTQKKKPAR